MEFLIIVLIILFGLDIIVGIIFGLLEVKRACNFDKRLWWIEQRLDYDLADDIFPDYKDGNEDDEK